MSTPTIKEMFTRHFPLTISRRQVLEVKQYMIHYELRDKNPEVLNTAMLGLDSPRFFDKDQQAVFDIFDIEKKEFSVAAWNCPGVDKNFKISSDPYNLFTMWVVHNTFKSNLPTRDKEGMMVNLLKLMNYKFFSSLVNWRFKYRANEPVMQKTIDGLSAKYSIRKPETPTWKLVIEKRCEEFVQKNSVHYHTIEHFSPDPKILYAITDPQTRLRTTIQNVVTEYYKNLELGLKIKEESFVNEIGDERVIKELVSSFDTLVDRISGQVLNLNTFIDYDMIKVVTNLNSTLRGDALRRFLVTFSDYAVAQNTAGKSEIMEKHGDTMIFIGYKKLIAEVIQKSYRSCMMKKVNMKSKLAILEHVSNIYKSSRIADPGVVAVKESVEKLVRDLWSTTREQTVTTLKIGFILYILLLTFK